MLEENAEAVARVSKTFGQNGELTLNLYDSFPQDFNPSEPLFVVIDKLAVPLFCDRFQRRGRSGAVVTFGDIDTERRAAELIGLELYLSPGPDEEDDEGDGLIYLEDLVGYTVRLTGENPDTPVSNPPPPSSSPESKPASEPGLKHSATGSAAHPSGCSAVPGPDRQSRSADSGRRRVYRRHRPGTAIDRIRPARRTARTLLLSLDTSKRAVTQTVLLSTANRTKEFFGNTCKPAQHRQYPAGTYSYHKQMIRLKGTFRRPSFIFIFYNFLNRNVPGSYSRYGIGNNNRFYTRIRIRMPVSRAHLVPQSAQPCRRGKSHKSSLRSAHRLLRSARPAAPRHNRESSS